MNFKFKFFISIVLLQSFNTLSDDCIETRAAFDIGSRTTKLKVYVVNKCEGQIVRQIETVGDLECESNAAVGYKKDLATYGGLSK